MMNNSITLRGAFYLRLIDEKGQLKDERVVANVITTAGKNFLAAWLAAAAQAVPFMNYVAVGTGSTAVSSGDTALEIELFRKVATITSNANVWQSQVNLAAGEGTGDITECGILSANIGGTLLAHQTFATISKAAGDQLQLTWQVSLS